MRILFFILAVICLHICVNATIILPPAKPLPLERNIMIPLTGTDKFLSVEEFLKLTPKSYKQLTGKKMNLDQKMDLMLSKMMIKKMIHKKGKVDLATLKQRGFFGGWHWHWGGFALGLFLSLLGPIVALFFNDEYKWDRFWTAMHTSVWIFLIFVAILAASGAGVY